MCVVIYNRDTGKEATSPKALRKMLGVTELVVGRRYKEIQENACLCPVDCEASITAAGFHYAEINGDYMNVEIWKDEEPKSKAAS
jgi:hypothetical protein